MKEMAKNRKSEPERIGPIAHPDWPEYLKDVSAHWSELAEIEGVLWHPTTVNTIISRLDDMTDRFRKTFYPEIPNG